MKIGFISLWIGTAPISALSSVGSLPIYRGVHIDVCAVAVGCVAPAAAVRPRPFFAVTFEEQDGLAFVFAARDNASLHCKRSACMCRKHANMGICSCTSLIEITSEDVRGAEVWRFGRSGHRVQSSVLWVG